MALLVLDSLDAAALEADATLRFKDGSDAAAMEGGATVFILNGSDGAAMEVEERRCDNPEADCNANR